MTDLAKQMLGDRANHIVAHEKFVKGVITREQAAAMMINDPDWVAEYELQYSEFDKQVQYKDALSIVNKLWLPKAVKYAQTGVYKPC